MNRDRRTADVRHPLASASASNPSRIGPGRHVCLIHRDSARALSVAAAFLRDGLVRGERCTFLSGAHAMADVERALSRLGVDIGSERERGSLVMVAPQKLHPAEPFEPTRVAGSILEMLGAAHHDPPLGARIAIEAAPPRDAAREWMGATEALVDALLQKVGPVSVLCIYDQNRLPADLLIHNIECHTEILLNDRVVHNPFYRPSRLRRVAPEERFEWMLDWAWRLRGSEEAREALERLQAIVRASPLPIAVIDSEGRVELWSPAAERVFGWTADEAVGGVLPHVPGEKQAEFRALLGRVLRGEALDGVEVVRRRKDGTEIEVSLWCAPLRDRDGQIRGVLSVLEDITQQKQLEREREQLLERERQIKAQAEEREQVERALGKAAAAIGRMFTIKEVTARLVSGAKEAVRADGAFVLRLSMDTQELEVVAVSGETALPVGLRIPYVRSVSEQVLEQGEPLFLPRLAQAGDALPDEIATRYPDWSALVLHLVDAGGAIGTLFLLRGPDREAFSAEEIARAETCGHLAAVGYRKIHLLRDEERRREELQRVMGSRERLIRGFSHDVKNPLGAADGHLQLLEMGLDGALSETQSVRVERARRSIGSALGLINDLLELARAEAGEIQIERSPVDLRAAVREMIEEYRAQAESKGLRVRVEVPDELPLLRTDRSRVHQILGNLILNAVKYTEEGTVVVRVQERRREDAPASGGWVVIDVADTGPGVPEEKQDLIFDEFTRLEPGQTRGAGLGLAISRRIARALGGEITLESEVGRGSTFTLWLPLGG